MCDLRCVPWYISSVVTIAQACMMFLFAVSTSKFGATLGDFMFGKTVKAQVILFHNVQLFLVVCYSGTLMGYVLLSALDTCTDLGHGSSHMHGHGLSHGWCSVTYSRFIHLKILELTELARAENLLHLVRSSYLMGVSDTGEVK